MAFSGVVIAPADNPFAGFRLFLVNPVTQDALDVGDGTGLTDGFGIEVGRGELRRLEHEVRVRVDEARYEAFAIQVYQLCISSLSGHDFCHGTDSQDPAFFYSQCLHPVSVL